MESYQIKLLDEYTKLYKNYSKLCYTLDLYENNDLNFELSCPSALLRRQRKVMNEYLEVLEERIELEGIKGEIEKWL